jgi:hypothetical protein
MDWNFAPTQIEHVVSVLRQRWPKLTNEDLQLLRGKKEMFLSRLQQRYGMAERDAERELDRVIASMDTMPPTHPKSLPLRPEHQHPTK